MHLLIPYVQLRYHADPLFEEFTYGDVNRRARKLKSDLEKGDYVFFHMSRDGKKFITAYYVVDRTLDTVAACQDRAIRAKYKNPHLLEHLAGERAVHGEDDVILFGDPITSRVLDKPLPFDKSLASKLSLDIKFPANRSEAQAIGSATRTWRGLTDQDVETLLDAIQLLEESQPKLATLRSTDEVAEVIEKDIEGYIASNSALIGEDLELVGRQIRVTSGRLDLLFEDSKGNLTVVELKLNRIGRGALRQVRGYVQDLRKETTTEVTGVIVCPGVMPAYEADIRKQKDVKVLVYGWELRVRPWKKKSWPWTFW